MSSGSICVRLARDVLASTFQVLKMFVFTLKKATSNVVENFNTWNVVAKQASLAHLMRVVWLLGV